MEPWLGFAFPSSWLLVLLEGYCQQLGSDNRNGCPIRKLLYRTMTYQKNPPESSIDKGTGCRGRLPWPMTVRGSFDEVILVS